MDYYRNLSPNQLDPDFPTFFELYASKQLEKLISPYIRYILVHFAQRYPAYLLKIATNYDEIYLILIGILEYAYLKNYNSSFVEKFYGLKRVSHLKATPQKSLKSAPTKTNFVRTISRKQILMSVIMQVALPYLKDKLDVRLNDIKLKLSLNDANELRQNKNLKQLWVLEFDLFVFKYYPKVRFALDFADVLLAAGYLFKNTNPFSIDNLICKTRYSRVQNEINESKFKSRYEKLLGAVGYALPATLFGIKFMEWWQQSDIANKVGGSGVVVVPPEKRGGVKTCAVCRKPPVTPSVLETGVLCCYECVDEYAREVPESSKVVCPLTGRQLLQVEFSQELGRWEVQRRRLIV